MNLRRLMLRKWMTLSRFMSLCLILLLGINSLLWCFLKSPMSVIYNEMGSMERQAGTKLMIATNWRSGSTFLHELMSSTSGTLAIHEPLQGVGSSRAITKDELSESLDTLKRLFQCDFSGSLFRFWTHDHKSIGWKFPHLRIGYIWCRIWRFWDKSCWIEMVNKFCLIHPHIVVKSVRPRLRPLEQLLIADASQKLLLIVRDPRGSMSSRKNVHWCRGDCHSIQILCESLINDWQAALEFNTKYPGRVGVVRYEELVANPILATESLLTWAGLGFTTSSRAWLDDHSSKGDAMITKCEEGSCSQHMSTYRKDPNATAHAWRKNTDWEIVSSVQSTCEKGMKLWGYLPLDQGDVTSRTTKDILQLNSILQNVTLYS